MPQPTMRTALYEWAVLSLPAADAVYVIAPGRSSNQHLCIRWHFPCNVCARCLLMPCGHCTRGAGLQLLDTLAWIQLMLL